MARTRWCAVWMGTLAVLMTACGSDPAPHPTEAPAAEAAPLELSGIVLLQHEGETGLDEIAFADPATGAVKTVLPLPGRDTSLTRFSGPATKLDVVSPDGQYATLETDEGVDVFKLNPADRRYERTASVPAPERSMSEKASRFRNPRFGPAGPKLFFDDGAAVYSVDYRQPGTPVKEAEIVPNGFFDQHVRDWWLGPRNEVLTWRDAHRTGDGTAYLTDSSGAIAYAVYETPGATYNFVTTLDAATVLLSAVTGTDEHGALLQLHFDGDTARAVKLVDRSEPRIAKTAASPDKATVLYQTDRGEWFASPTTPGAVARPALPQLPPAGSLSERRLVGWA
ncbi:hypothetical protein [Amycolatopsis australiensis]|uniref:WD40-like Beta Propeller Repeat n=1 Tax=Amycolatopsis australiensis TaxID=546364 RepID=A0A1K1QR45_9PSEU|nr:hypothetical protein [Amycolatopsis australiensis]SFW62410.1 hypothetical protein SAMN04489730_2128 [Amycolatopsis australiensis]